jgi:SNF2 family DNA or RNA helicase
LGLTAYFLQAIARVHRMGQTRSVVVKKLVIRDTVEQRVIQLQTVKNLLVQGALGMNKEEASALRLRDLHSLFGS